MGNIYSGSSMVAVIDSDGYVSASNIRIGRVQSSDVYDTHGNKVGKFETNGSVYNRQGSHVGRVDSGTVYDKNGSTVGRAEAPHQMGGGAALLLLIR